MATLTAAHESRRRDWATHPGDHLAEYIETNGWTQADFARLSGLSPKHVSTLVNGTNPVTPETAIKLERVLGLKADIWLGLQANWDLHRARTDEQSTREAKTWLSRFPVKELKKRGWLPATKDEPALFDALLGFLGVGALGAYEAKVGALAVHHRQAKAHASNPDHVFAWLTLGERRARLLDLPRFDADGFQTALKAIRALTVEAPAVFAPRMTELCRNAGVALIFEPPISKTRLYGSARWLDADRAIIQMSLRMKFNDHFWWTFFHEAAHLILHRGQNFADDQNGIGDGVEGEADAWASEILVRREAYVQFKAKRPHSKAGVRAFANKIGLHPGIVVGMLQHDRSVPYTDMNELKARFEWAPHPSNENAEP